MFFRLVSFTTVLPCCCKLPPCTAMYSSPIPCLQISSWNHPVNLTQILIWIKNKSAKRSRCIAKRRELRSVPAVLGGAGHHGRDWRGHQWQTRDTQMAPEAPTASGVSGNSAPCTGDPVRTGKDHSEVYSEEDLAEKTWFRKHKTLVTFSFFHPPDIKTVKTKIRGIMRVFYTAQRMSIKFQDISSMIHVHQQSL